MNAYTHTAGAPTAQNLITHAQRLAEMPAAQRTLGWHIAAVQVGHVSALSALTARS